MLLRPITLVTLQNLFPNREDKTKMLTFSRSSNCGMSVMVSALSVGTLAAVDNAFDIIFLYLVLEGDVMCARYLLVITLCFTIFIVALM